MRTSFFLAFFLAFSTAYTKETAAAVSEKSIEKLRAVVRKYQRSGIVEMKVDKKVISEIMGVDRLSSGKLSVAPKRFKFETEEPDRTLIVYDGKTLWTAQYPPKGSEGKIQVGRAQLGKKNMNQVMLSDILTGPKPTIVTEFDFISEKTEDHLMSLGAKPKATSDQIKDLSVVVDLKAKEIAEINYTDELGNKTSMKFSDQKFISKDKAQPKKVFQYEPEKGAEVSDL